MKDINQKYYEPLEQMMAIRHQYMAKIVKLTHELSIYKFFSKRKILDLGCGTGEFLHNYHELGSICTGIDIYNNFKFDNKKDFKLINTNINNFFKINKNKYDVIFLFEFIEHLNLEEKEILFKKISKILNSNGLIFISTINKNLISKFFSIDIAENLLNLLPKKTHDTKLFLTPSELYKLTKKNGFHVYDIKGISYNPLIKNFSLSKIDLINYFATIKN